MTGGGRGCRATPAWSAGAPELIGAALAAAVGAALALLGRPALLRTAASGRRVSLAGGPATAVGLLAAVALARGPRSCSPAAALAVSAAALAGGLDDLAERPPAAAGGLSTTRAALQIRGLAGHLGALRRGRVTTGSLKIVVVGGGAVAAAAVLARSRANAGSAGRPVRGTRGLRLATDAGLIAGTANLLNLFDLRPGRAAKVALLATGVLLGTGSGPAPGVLGVVAATMPGDLRGRWMLGDTGANALGAALGVQVAAAGGWATRLWWLAVVLALTVASERVSFTAVIAGHPLLRALDDLGRR